MESCGGEEGRRAGEGSDILTVAATGAECAGGTPCGPDARGVVVMATSAARAQSVPDGSRTRTGAILSRLPLPLGYGDNARLQIGTAGMYAVRSTDPVQEEETIGVIDLVLQRHSLERICDDLDRLPGHR